MKSLVIILSILAASPACAKSRGAKMKSSAKSPGAVVPGRSDIEIVPGKSIGEVHLGDGAAELPKRVVLSPPAGELDGVRFLVDSGGRIEDVWIEDLRTFPGALTYGGKTSDKKATVAQLQTIFGKCSRVEGVKGGIFYNCASGIGLGTDFLGKTLQVRVKSR